MLISRLLLVVVAACLLGAGCSGPEPWGPANAEVPTYRCRLAAGPIKIDGSLDDPAWADAPFSADFIRRRVGVRIMPKNIHTRMKMLHDDGNLYVGVECRDSDILGYLFYIPPFRFDLVDFRYSLQLPHVFYAVITVRIPTCH